MTNPRLTAHVAQVDLRVGYVVGGYWLMAFPGNSKCQSIARPSLLCQLTTMLYRLLCALGSRGLDRLGGDWPPPAPLSVELDQDLDAAGNDVGGVVEPLKKELRVEEDLF